MSAPASENQAIDELVAECCAELFADYGLNVQARARDESPAIADLAVCGVMGFGGERVRGVLVLAATLEPLEHTDPGNQTTQVDWIGELANQLAGRVKNKLLLRNVEILLATPTAFRGEHLSPVATRLRPPQVFTARGGMVCVWIDCEVTAGFEIPAGPIGAVEAPVAEGDTILF